MSKVDESDAALNEITETIIGCAFRVNSVLGSGFLEKVYENALAHEIRKSGLVVAQQHPIPVYYDGVIVGDYFADLMVQQQVIVELKAARISTKHTKRRRSTTSRQRECPSAS